MSANLLTLPYRTLSRDGQINTSVYGVTYFMGVGRRFNFLQCGSDAGGSV